MRPAEKSANPQLEGTQIRPTPQSYRGASRSPLQHVETCAGLPPGGV